MPSMSEGGVAAPALVTSFADFERAFGDAAGLPGLAVQHLAQSVRLFFENGGRRCFIVGIANPPDGALLAEDIIGQDGEPGKRTGIHALEDIPELLTIAAPGWTDVAIQQALIAQCERRRDRLAVLDCEPASLRPGGLDAIRAHRGVHDTSFAAYYAPWVTIGGLRVPPSGAIAGVIARVDQERGVWAAPANESVRSVDGLDTAFTSSDQDVLNPAGVNVIRAFSGRGILVWGARTLTQGAELKYVNVRRLLMFLTASIDRGTRWVVFEPNSAPTWDAVASAVEDFLFGLWRKGALQGQRPGEAFYARCDRNTMTQDDLDNGRLVCEIGVAVIRPAEFIMFRIGQWTAEAR
jgi:phage tail sheath protein FI